ncbi:MAG: hypothetical protein JSV13_02605 [Nitrospiraceae bacterium]|nr:MAG: hypothetical protein JSV13_02605 [Nitrospiraceae bacterium]
MNYIRNTIFLLLVLASACAYSVSSIRLEEVDTIPQKSFETYLYSAGFGEIFRAILLKDPDSLVEIVPYTVQIRKATGTFDDAILFMSRGRLYKRVHVQSIMYKGEKIGYLLTQPRKYGPYNIGYVEVNLFERSGKIYFDVDEKIIYGE